MREFLRHFKIYFYSSIVVFSLFLFTRVHLLHAYGIQPLEQLHFTNTAKWVFYISLPLLFSALLSMLLSSIDVLVLGKILYKKSLGFVFTVGLVIQSIILFFLVSTTDTFVHLVLKTISGKEVKHVDAEEFLIWIVFIIFSVTLSRFIIEIDKKLGPGNLWKIATGKFYNPREEERIFMFIDLKSSTTIAERLGHFKYSHLIQDCFNDFSVVDKYNAEIYQYVGDEVVISWPVNEVKNYRRFLTAFFAFQRALENRRAYYEKEYDVFPIFKAGAHAGPIIVTEVGQIKREISYHGDTLNTSARIQEKCNELGANLLISEALYTVIQPYSPYKLNDVGAILLKGKTKEVRLYKVTA